MRVAPRPHHVTQNIVDALIVVRWIDGWYLGEIKELIPIRRRQDENNVKVYYAYDNTTVLQRLTVSQYATYNEALSPSWCMLESNHKYK